MIIRLPWETYRVFSIDIHRYTFSCEWINPPSRLHNLLRLPTFVRFKAVQIQYNNSLSDKNDRLVSGAKNNNFGPLIFFNFFY